MADILAKTIRNPEQFRQVFHKNVHFSQSTKDEDAKIPSTVGKPILHQTGTPIMKKGRQIKMNWKKFIQDAISKDKNPGCPPEKQFVRYRAGHYYCTSHSPSSSDILDFMDDIIRAYLSNGFASNPLEELSFSELHGYETQLTEFKWLLKQRIEFVRTHKHLDARFFDHTDKPLDLEQLHNSLPKLTKTNREHIKTILASTAAEVKAFRDSKPDEALHDNRSVTMRNLLKKDKTEFNDNWIKEIDGRSDFVHKPRRGKTYKGLGGRKQRRTVRRCNSLN
jgi:hypothetical protein